MPDRKAKEQAEVGNRRTDYVERLDAFVSANDKANAVIRTREELGIS